MAVVLLGFCWGLVGVWGLAGGCLGCWLGFCWCFGGVWLGFGLGFAEVLARILLELLLEVGLGLVLVFW